MTDKYMINRLVLQSCEFDRYAENPKDAFLDRVLERATPPQSWFKRKGIETVSDGIIWLTDGVDFYPAWASELVPYYGDEPVGTLVEKTETETA